MKKKKAPRKKRPSKPTYLREIQIRFKKKRVGAGTPVGKSITGSQQVYELFKGLQNEAKEKLISISLDTNLKIICFEVVAIGSLNSVYVRPVEAIRAAIPLNPYSIIMVHNHPSGDPTPSPQDKDFTLKLMYDCQNLGIILCDHIIIGDTKYFSFLDKGLLDQFADQLKEFDLSRITPREQKRKRSK